jgi:hypothetical protein
MCVSVIKMAAVGGLLKCVYAEQGHPSRLDKDDDVNNIL